MKMDGTTLRRQCEKLRTWRYILGGMRSKAVTGQWLLETLIPSDIGAEFMDKMAERLKSKGFERMSGYVCCDK